MMLSIETYKTRKADCCPVYKTYRYPCFDKECAGDDFGEKFNNAFKTLKNEIQQDRENNDMTLYNPIIVCNVFIS